MKNQRFPFLFLLCLFGLLIGCDKGNKKQTEYQAGEEQVNESSPEHDWLNAGKVAQNGNQTSNGNSNHSSGDPTTSGTNQGGPSNQSGSGKGSTQTKNGNTTGPVSVGSGTGIQTGPINSNPDATTSNDPDVSRLLARLHEAKQAFRIKFEQLNNDPNSKKDPAKAREILIDLLKELVGVVDQLVVKQLRERDRLEVVSLKIEAHRQLMLYGEPGQEEKLYTFMDTIAEDPDPAIQKQYKILRFRQLFGKVVRKESDNWSELKRQFKYIVSFWRDDPAVLQSARNWLTGMHNLGVREEYIDALEIAADSFEKSANPSIKTQGKVFRDQLTINQLGMDLAMTDLMLNREGASKKILESTKRILARPRLSTYIIKQLDQIGRELEVRHDYAAAYQFFEIFKESAKKIGNPKVREILLTGLEASMRRNSVIGTPIKIDGMVPTNDNGKLTRKRIDQDRLKGKVVLLFFWSATNGRSYQFLQLADRFYNANSGKDFELIGVNLDADEKLITQIMVQEAKIRKWMHLLPLNPTKKGMRMEIAEQFGVDMLPFTVLIDKEGIVRHIRVFNADLEDQVSKLLGEPVNRIFVAPPSASGGKGAKKDSKKGDTKTASNPEDSKKDSKSSSDPSKPVQDAKAKKQDSKKADLVNPDTKNPESKKASPPKTAGPEKKPKSDKQSDDTRKKVPGLDDASKKNAADASPNKSGETGGGDDPKSKTEEKNPPKQPAVNTPTKTAEPDKQTEPPSPAVTQPAK